MTDTNRTPEIVDELPPDYRPFTRGRPQGGRVWDGCRLALANPGQWVRLITSTSRNSVAAGNLKTIKRASESLGGRWVYDYRSVAADEHHMYVCYVGDGDYSLTRYQADD